MITRPLSDGEAGRQAHRADAPRSIQIAQRAPLITYQSGFVKRKICGCPSSTVWLRLSPSAPLAGYGADLARPGEPDRAGRDGAAPGRDPERGDIAAAPIVQ